LAKKYADQLHEIKTKLLDTKRKEVVDDNDIKEWFEKLRVCLEEYDISRGEIWNFDEIGF
jgi:hypothetical protein